MNKRYERYPENALGHFYVAKDYCICCRLPEEKAPDLMGFANKTEDAASMHCFFKRQPSTLDELERAMEALRICCCSALRYAGRDIKILQRLKQIGCQEQCDALNDADEPSI
jgi:hypothetical protein